MDDSMTIDLSMGESGDADEDEGAVQLGQENSTVELSSSNTSIEDEDEAHSEGHEVPLEGSMLAGMNYDGEDPMDLARARLAATPWMLFPSTSQPGSSDPEHERRPSFSSPPIPPVTCRSKHIADSVDRH